MDAGFRWGGGTAIGREERWFQFRAVLGKEKEDLIYEWLSAGSSPRHTPLTSDVRFLPTNSALSCLPCLLLICTEKWPQLSGMCLTTLHLTSLLSLDSPFPIHPLSSLGPSSLPPIIQDSAPVTLQLQFSQ